jgi:hypothetical protein
MKITYQRYLMDQQLRDSIEAEARRARAEHLHRLFADAFGSLRRATVKWEPFHRGSHVPGRAAQG